MLDFIVSIEMAKAAIDGHDGHCLYPVHTLNDWLSIDHALVSQASDLGLVQAHVLPQHLISMLS